jgi:NAD(P)-dependent dehydrogenase (short-subunit alcohol dehydrogenase family)
MPIRKYSPPEGPRCWADQDTRISWVHHCELNVIVIVFIPLPVPFLDLAGQGAEVEIEMVDRQASSKRSPSPSPSTSPRPRRVQQLAGEVFARHGDVDLPCNNAGVIPIGRILDTDMRDWHWVYDVNVLLVHCARAFVPRMIAQHRPAHVINTASMAAFAADPDLGVYRSIKHACTSSTPRWNGSTGTTPEGCTTCSITSRRTTTRAPITLNPRRPSRRRLNNEAGIKLGTVQEWRHPR